MELPSLKHASLFLSCLLISFIISNSTFAQADSSFELAAGALQWPSTASAYSGIELELDEDQEEGADIIDRRSLYWRRPIHRYYISYGALSANRIPCPARSGRSYYTHNCHLSNGPANPYNRGCSAITRCRR